MKVLIPKDYLRIACTEFIHNKGEIYFNLQERKYYIVIDEEKAMGPISIDQMKVLIHVTKDVIDLKGRYTPV